MTEGTVDRRTLIGGFVTAVATSGLAGAACAQSAPKTFVLVHGAFLGGWCWRRVSDRLAESGHKVFSPTLSGLGERSHLLSNSVNFDTHVADIVNVIKWEGLNDICLVVHSYGGAPGSGALDQIGDRVSSIVWLDAFKPKNGERMMDLSPVFGKLVQGAIDKGEAGFAPASFKMTTAAVNERDVDLFASKATPQPVGSYTQPMKLSGAIEQVAKKTYIRLPKYPNPNFDKALSECKADNSWSTVEIADCGHVAMLDIPQQLTELLIKAA